MATNVATSTMNYPFPMGKLMPGGATVSIPVTQNYQPGGHGNDGAFHKDNQFNELVIIASPDNTGNGTSGYMFICNSAAAPDTVAYTNVLAWLQPGQAWAMSKEWASNRDISKVFVGALNATDFAIASINAF